MCFFVFFFVTEVETVYLIYSNTHKFVVRGQQCLGFIVPARGHFKRFKAICYGGIISGKPSFSLMEPILLQYNRVKDGQGDLLYICFVIC